MVNIVIRDKCTWTGGVLGWRPWKYSQDKTVISMHDKAGFIIDCMDAFKVIPTDLDDDEIDNHIIYVGVTGDKLYHDIIPELNDNLKSRYNDDIQIYTSITGEKAHWDDCHLNEKAYKEAIKKDNDTKAGNKLAKDVSKICRCKKANDIRIDMGFNAKYTRSPEERYTTHLSDQIDPLIEYFDKTLDVLNSVDWNKTSEFRTCHMACHLLLTKDMLSTFNTSLKIFQRCQNYRGYVEICDENQHQALNCYIEKSKKFREMIDNFVKTKDLNILEKYSSLTRYFQCMHANLKDIVEDGNLWERI